MAKVFPKDTEAPPGGVDDMTKLSYLHEPGVLHNLAARYELNEIYVGCLVFSFYILSADVDFDQDREILTVLFYYYTNFLPRHTLEIY